MTIQFNFKKATLITLISLTALTSYSYAHQGATGIVKQRMDSMSEMGEALGQMADMVKGKKPFDAGRVRASAMLMEQHAETLLDFFPDTTESRSGNETEALPAIWQSWEQFSEASNTLESQIASFNQVTATESTLATLKQEFRKIARACSACHDDFRKPKD